MATKYPGVYLYFDWLKGLEKMPAQIAMQIISNLHHYAEEGREPQPLDDLHFEIVQEVYLDQIKRAQRRSESCRQSAYARHRKKTKPLPESSLTDPEALRLAMAEKPIYGEDDDPEELLRLGQALQKGLQGGEGSRSRP